MERGFKVFKKDYFDFTKLFKLVWTNLNLYFKSYLYFWKQKIEKEISQKNIYRRGQPAELAHPWPNIVPVAAQHQPTATYRFVS